MRAALLKPNRELCTGRICTLRGKFDDLTAPYLGESDRDALAEALLSLDQCSDMRALLALTRSRPDTRLRAAGSDD